MSTAPQRVYLASTPPQLARAVATGRLPEPLVAHAVTPALREWYREGDAEELELAALLDAALSSVRLLAEELAHDASGRPRRVVLAADVPAASVSPLAGATGDGDDPDRSRVRVAGGLDLHRVVSAHVDEADAEDDVRAAAVALPAADAGDDDAAFTVDGADGHDLLWYDASELAALAEELSGR